MDTKAKNNNKMILKRSNHFKNERENIKTTKITKNRIVLTQIPLWTFKSYLDV